jgi:hypothetical protein
MDAIALPRPLPNSYWATPLLLASEYPGAPTDAAAIPKLDALLAAGIRDFYDLTETHELVPYEALLRERATHAGLAPGSIRYRRLPVRDLDLPSAERLVEVLALLAESAAAGRGALLGRHRAHGHHCGLPPSAAARAERGRSARLHRPRVADRGQARPRPALARNRCPNSLCARLPASRAVAPAFTRRPPRRPAAEP